RRRRAQRECGDSFRVSLEAADEKVRVGVEQAVRIELFHPVEQARPYDRDDERRDRELGKARGLAGAELAACDAAFDDGANDVHAPRDDLAMIESGELREASRFAEDQARDVLAARAENLGFRE